jgi:hypothetical protein
MVGNNILDGWEQQPERRGTTTYTVGNNILGRGKQQIIQRGTNNYTRRTSF